MSKEATVVRFSVKQRIEHFAVMILFIVLSVTGFPQKFYETGWARWLVGFMGGVEGARVIHLPPCRGKRLTPDLR